MAVRNVTEEVEVLRAEKRLFDRIESASLSASKATFILKALILAGHVSEHTMEKALDLAETICGLD